MKNTQYKYLNLLSMLYMTIKLMTVVLIYKTISIGSFSASASTFVMPLWFAMGDIIAEVYGYKVARQMIWIAISCQFLFAFVCAGLISFKSPTEWLHQEAYDQVLGKLPRVALASFLGIICGAFINAYAISRWKILIRGKYFWLRSLGASAIGELIFTIIVYLTEFFGIAPTAKLLSLIIISYTMKIILNTILVIPSSAAVYILKKLEGIDIYDIGIDFNLFKITLDEKNLNHYKEIESTTT